MSDHQIRPGFGDAHTRPLRERWAAVHTSVFAKLVAVMVTMAACLVLLVSGFFWMIVSLTLNTASDRMHEAHAALFVVLLIIIDEEKVRTVLRNLLENAANYSLPTSRPVEISATQSTDTVVIRVTDDGAGIPDGDVERIFEPFFRVDRSRSKSTGGYGLGLSICKRVMEAHGGSITVERQPRRGTSFVLAFPKTAFAKSA